MRADDRDGLRAYRFETIPGDRVDALVSTRLGGASTGPHAALNLGLHVGDDNVTVVANRRAFFSAFGLPFERSVWCKQVHADTVAVIDSAHAGAGREDDTQAIGGTDALVTDVPDLPLCVMMADCVPVVLYDPEHHALGLAHAGWRGTVKRICSRTVETMTAQYGTDPAALVAAIGPSIGPEHYEVGANVITAAREAYGDAPILRALDGGNALFDLWAANEHDLRSAGVTQVEMPDTSTVGALDEFYSHRFEAGDGVPHTGRFATVSRLRERA